MKTPTLREVLGKNVRVWRMDLGLSQQELAHQMNALEGGTGRKGRTGRPRTWAHPAISAIENGERQVTLEEAILLSIALKTNLASLVSPAWRAFAVEPRAPGEEHWSETVRVGAVTLGPEDTGKFLSGKAFPPRAPDSEEEEDELRHRLLEEARQLVQANRAETARHFDVTDEAEGLHDSQIRGLPKPEANEKGEGSR